MTIEQLYQEAVKMGRTDWIITVYDYDGCTRSANEIEWDEENEEAFIS